MIKNNKGFTIIELLVAIMIIGILAVVAVPLINKYLENGRQKYYSSLDGELEIMAKNYFTDNQKELPRGQLNEKGSPIYYKVLTVSELKAKNYITNDIVDTKNNSCEKSYVTVTNYNGEYSYYPCLICGEEVVYGDKEFCTLSGVKDTEAPTCNVTNYNGSGIKSWYNTDVLVTVKGTDESGIKYFMVSELNEYKVNSDKNDIGTFTINKTGTYTIKVIDKLGNSGTCTTGKINIDKTKPTCEMKIVASSMTQKTIEITGYEDVTSVAGLKIGDTNLTISQNKGQTTVYKNGTYTGTVTDTAGNTNTCSINVTGIQTTFTNVAISGTSDASFSPRTSYIATGNSINIPETYWNSNKITFRVTICISQGGGGDGNQGDFAFYVNYVNKYGQGGTFIPWSQLSGTGCVVNRDYTFSVPSGIKSIWLATINNANGRAYGAEPGTLTNVRVSGTY